MKKKQALEKFLNQKQSFSQTKNKGRNKPPTKGKPSFGFVVEHQDKEARAGKLFTARGEAQTPLFMPVATQAALRSVPPQLALESQCILANTYHLHIQPGEEVVSHLGGLHSFMNWGASIITDSGGYQVFSLPKKEVTENGVRFFSSREKQKVELTPEKSMHIQTQLGSDVAMLFDECVPYPTKYTYAKAAMERTLRWAKRCLNVPPADNQVYFGIVQGSTYPDLRKASALETAALDLPGIALGGLSVGEGLEVMEEVLSFSMPHLPQNKPRYLMGIGLPEDILSAVEAGIDLCDCIIPTRYARSGILFTKVGKLRITQNKFRKDSYPLDTSCSCSTCKNYSRSYLHHLFSIKEFLGYTLASVHNLHFYSTLMKDIRQAIAQKKFQAFKKAFLYNYQRSNKKKKAHVR